MQNKFSPSEAATSFFSFFKAHPKFVLRIMGYNGALTLVMMAGFGLSGYFEMMGQLLAISQTGKQPSPDKMMALFTNMNWPVMAAILIAAIFLSVAFVTMGLRKTVRNEEIGFHGLTWGKDENQLLIAMLQLWLVGFLGYVALLIGIGVSAAMKMPLIAVLLGVGFVLFLIFMLGRFGMYGVLTIANRKAGTFASFDYSKEQFWSFVGAFFLNGIIVMIISMVVQGSLGAIFAPMMGENINGMPSSLAGFFSIGAILYFGAVGAVSGLTQLAMVCTGAYAYHKISESVTTEPTATEAQ